LGLKCIWVAEETGSTAKCQEIKDGCGKVGTAPTCEHSGAVVKNDNPVACVWVSTETGENVAKCQEREDKCGDVTSAVTCVFPGAVVSGTGQERCIWVTTLGTPYCQKVEASCNDVDSSELCGVEGSAYDKVAGANISCLWLNGTLPEGKKPCIAMVFVVLGEEEGG
jgi:hypothetical protein